jgi:S1-C subfamily serine protease
MAQVFRVSPFLRMLALTLGAAALSGPAVRAQTESGVKVYERTLKGTVWVISPLEGGKRMATGTGSVIDHARRLVLTNYHVVADREQVYAVFPVFQKGDVIAEREFYTKLLGNKKGLIAGKILTRDSKRDLALIQLEVLPPGVQQLPLARESAKPGQRIHSIGNPGASGALWVYTPGEVRQVYRKKFQSMDRSGQSPFEVDARIVETSSPVNAGDSGGPVVNERGELVAVTQGHSADAQARLVSYFIDVSEVKELLKSKGIKNLVPTAAAGTALSTERPAPAPAKAATPELSAEQKAESEAARKLKLAQQLADAGKTEKAKERCQDIIKDYPKTEAAKQAEQLIQKLTK